MIDHVSIQCNDMAASTAFYDAVLATVGGKQIFNLGESIGYGLTRPTFWISDAVDPGPAKPSHLAFIAPDRDGVLAFFEAAVAVGAEVLHQPKPWPEYHSTYFGAFVRDPDGNNVEAVCHGPA